MNKEKLELIKLLEVNKTEISSLRTNINFYKNNFESERNKLLTEISMLKKNLARKNYELENRKTTVIEKVITKPVEVKRAPPIIIKRSQIIPKKVERVSYSTHHGHHCHCHCHCDCYDCGSNSRHYSRRSIYRSSHPVEKVVQTNYVTETVQKQPVVEKEIRKRTIVSRGFNEYGGQIRSVRSSLRESSVKKPVIRRRVSHRSFSTNKRHRRIYNLISNRKIYLENSEVVYDKPLKVTASRLLAQE